MCGIRLRVVALSIIYNEQAVKTAFLTVVIQTDFSACPVSLYTQSI